MLTHNSLFMQLVVCAMNKELSYLHNGLEAMDPTGFEFHDIFKSRREKVIQLYSDYLALEPVKHCVNKLQSRGQLQYPPDWKNADALNFFLPGLAIMDNQTAEKTQSAIVCSENTLSKIITGEDENIWQHVVFFARQQDDTPSLQWQQEKGACLEKAFPLLHQLYQCRVPSAGIHRLLETLFIHLRSDKYLARNVLDRFINAALHATKSEYFLHAYNSKAFRAQFQPLITDVDAMREHHNDILAIYQLSTASDREKAGLFLALAAFFTRLASFEYAGIKRYSVTMLQHYAFSLMNKSFQFQADIFGQDAKERFEKWRGVLKKASKDTGPEQLYEEIKTYMHHNCPDCLKYLPPGWGAGDWRHEAGSAAEAAVSAIYLAPV